MITDSVRTRSFLLKACPARIVLGTVACLGLVLFVPVSEQVLLLAFPWIVGMIIIVCDKVTPVRNWFGVVVTSLFYPLALVTYNAAVLHEWTRSGRLPNPGIAVLINVLLLACIAFFAKYLWPKHCPGCGHHSLLRLIPLFMSEQRSKLTHWCARCGEQYWKQQQDWKPERRKTWWDRAKSHQSEDGFSPWADPDAEAGASM
jgi:hypothetical protein